MDCEDPPNPPPTLLDGKEDRYDGIIIDPTSLPPDAPSFLLSLRASLSLWKSQEKRGIWLKLPLQNANLVLSAVEEGFKFHHAEPDYVMLTNWISESASTIPANASHIIGVGALVINDQKEILVVQEKSGPTQSSGVWKMPTGVVNQAEDISAGVQREVREETGVDAEFIEVLGFRQSHNAAFGKSDIFIVCVLRARSSQIVIQETEIAAAKWMSLEEFKAQPFNNESTMLTRIADVASANLDGQYSGFSAELLTFGFRKKGSYFYHNVKDIRNYIMSKYHAAS